MEKAWWMTLPDQTLKESAWERQMHISGLEAFENKKAKEEASETSTGQRVIRKLLDRTEKSIKSMQRKEIHKSRVEREVKATTILVPSDTAALITLRSMIDRTYSTADPDTGEKFQALVNEVSRGIETELNFRNWIKESKKEAQEFAKDNGYDKAPKSMAEKLIEEEGVSKRSLNRWKKSFDALNTYKWDTLEEHYCGEAMVKSALDALPEVFVKKLIPIRGNPTNHVSMTPDFRAEFETLEARIAQMQVVRKPMLIRPEPWKRE